MILWLDAQISPAIANWIRKEFGLEVWPLFDLGLRDSGDKVIFRATRDKDAVLETKDADFARLQVERGAPPRIILLAFGNTSNQNLKRILSNSLARALELLDGGEALIEITEVSGES